MFSLPARSSEACLHGVQLNLHRNFIDNDHPRSNTNHRLSPQLLASHQAPFHFSWTKRQGKHHTGVIDPVYLGLPDSWILLSLHYSLYPLFRTPNHVSRCPMFHLCHICHNFILKLSRCPMFSMSAIYTILFRTTKHTLWKVF